LLGVAVESANERIGLGEGQVVKGIRAEISKQQKNLVVSVAHAAATYAAPIRSPDTFEAEFIIHGVSSWGRHPILDRVGFLQLHESQAGYSGSNFLPVKRESFGKIARWII
jgi:hypothetical protein